MSDEKPGPGSVPTPIPAVIGGNAVPGSGLFSRCCSDCKGVFPLVELEVFLGTGSARCRPCGDRAMDRMAKEMA